MYKITQVKVLPHYQLHLKFQDGTKGTVDLSKWVGKGVFKLWKNYHEFEKVKIGSLGELVWNEQVDLCPDSLYLQLTHKKPEDIFSNLQYKHKEKYA